MSGMLQGTRVVEMGHVVAVPSLTALLADWGAEVIKLEPLAGEMARSIKRSVGVETAVRYEGGEVSWLFEQLNRGKKSVALDLRLQRGRDVAYALVASCDVFVSNYEMSALTKLRMDYATLSGLNPRLVYAIVTGYGTTGPDKDERGFDYSAAWARSGMQYLIGEPGTAPPTQRPGMMDNVTAGYGAAAILGALLHSTRTGQGQSLEVSLYHAAVWSLNLDIAALLAGRPLPKDTRATAHNPLWNTYRTKDDRWVRLAMLQADAHWADFCRAIDRPDLTSDPRFLDMDARRLHHEELIPIIDAAMASRRLVEWEAVLREHHCIYSRVQTPSEVTGDPQAIANGFFVNVPHPIAGEVRLVATPARMHGTPAQVKGAAPQVGEHTEQMLEQLGYTWEDIAALKTEGVIW